MFSISPVGQRSKSVSEPPCELPCEVELEAPSAGRSKKRKKEGKREAHQVPARHSKASLFSALDLRQ